MKVLLSGCGGAMGKMLQRLISEKENIIVGAGVDKFAEQNAEYPIFNSFESCDTVCDAIIDFSHPSMLNGLLEYAVKNNVPAVICTTGLDEDQKSKIEVASKKVPIFMSANMSVGINLMTELLKKAASLLTDFDIEIIEKHHNKKLDAPSGTAYMLAESINEAINPTKELVHGRHGKTAKREPKEIGMHAVRGGTIVGEHQVHFIGEDEIVEIRHTALSKSVFAEGAIRASQFLVGKAPGMYDMSDMIKG